MLNFHHQIRSKRINVDEKLLEATDIYVDDSEWMLIECRPCFRLDEEKSSFERASDRHVLRLFLEHGHEDSYKKQKESQTPKRNPAGSPLLTGSKLYQLDSIVEAVRFDPLNPCHQL